MANKRVLKRDINYIFEDLIDATYLKQITNTSLKAEEVEAFVDQIVNSFDGIISKVNEKNVANTKAHFSAIHKQLDEITLGLVDQINKM